MVSINKILLLSVGLIFLVRSSLETLRYDIVKSYSGDIHQTKQVTVGILQVRRNAAYGQMQSSIEPNFSELVSSSDFGQGSVILSFVPKGMADSDSQNNIYKTAVVEKQIESQDQVIAVIVGVDFRIKAINYVEKRSPLQQIRSEVIFMNQGKQQIAKIQMAPKKGMGADGNPQEQSFFAKYKWPIIIGIVLLYLTSSGAGGDKPQEGAAAQ